MRSPRSTKADDLRRYTFDVAAGFLACGLDPARTILFRQSDVPQVHELAWLLSVVTPMGLLERAHSYKDKIAQGAETSHGLFAYPVLMAADILLYNSDLVPVGKDQKQHLEIARDIAQKFNDRFGPVFKLPEPIIREATAIVPGIDGRKMSKSYGNTIPLFGEEKEIKKPVMGIKTDSTPIEQPKQIEGTVLGQLMQAVNPGAYKDFVAQAATPGTGYGDLKKKLLAEIEARFPPFQEKYRPLPGASGRGRSHPRATAPTAPANSPRPSSPPRARRRGYRNSLEVENVAGLRTSGFTRSFRRLFLFS